MPDKPSFYVLNRGFAAAMDHARRDILDVLCASKPGLAVLGDLYREAGTNRFLERSVHVHVPRFAGTEPIAERVVRARASGIGETCYALTAKARVTPLARAELIDRMLDVRLPDKLIAGVPQAAVSAGYAEPAQAQALNTKTSHASARLIDAKGRMAEANLPLVPRFLHGYADRPDHKDIGSEGVLGLVNAVDRWDAASQLSFSSYAKTYIVGYAKSYVLQHSSTIQVPAHVHSTLDAVQDAETQAIARDGVLPSAEQVARELGMKPNEVRKWRSVRRDDHPFEHPELYGRDRALADTKTTYNPEADMVTGILRKQLHARLGQALQSLPPRQSKVLSLAFGLGDERLPEKQEATLKAIGELLQVSKPGVAKLQRNALETLRRGNSRWNLEPFSRALD